MIGTCVSHPKSGRTWLRVMLADIGLQLRFTHLDTGADDDSWGKPLALLDKPSCDAKRVIFLHRDPRDTVVSFFHDMTKRQRRRLKRRLKYLLQGRMPPRDLAKFVRSDRFGIEKIALFNLCCAENLDALFISYEALRADPVDMMSRILAYLDQDIPLEKIKQVVERNRFEAMKERESCGFYEDAALRPKNPTDPNSYKVRRGKVGGWCDEMDEGTQRYANDVLYRLEYFDRMSELGGRCKSGRCS